MQIEWNREGCWSSGYIMAGVGWWRWSGKEGDITIDGSSRTGNRLAKQEPRNNGFLDIRMYNREAVCGGAGVPHYW